MTYICAFCGKKTKYEDVKGSAKHPSCKKCFKEYFDNSEDAYDKFLRMTHNEKTWKANII